MPDAAPAPFVQPEAYLADGTPVAPDAIPEAVAKGQAFFKKGTRVAARNSEGQVVTIAAEDVGHPGYTVLSPAEVEQARTQKQYGEGLGNVAKATAAGAARGLTLGASDAVLSGIGGDDTRKALKGLREANPISSTAGEVGGALAPLVLSSGSSAAATGTGLAARAGGVGSTAVRTLGAGHRAIAGVGSLVERGAARGLEALGATGETALGRIGASGVKLASRGAAEGALYGGAQAASDSVLNGDDITAEKIVAGMGHGALFGGALGGALGLGGSALAEGAAKLVPKKEALQQLAREQAGRAFGFKASDNFRLAGRRTGKAAEERIALTQEDMLNAKIQTGEFAGQRVMQPGANVEENLARLSIAKQEATARLSGLKDELSEGMAAQGANPNVGEFLRRVDDDVFKQALKSNSPGVRGEVRAAERELSIIRQKMARDELNEIGLENTRYLRDGLREDSAASMRRAFAGATPEEANAIALGLAPVKEGLPGVGPRGGFGGPAKNRLDPVRVELYPGEAPALGDGRHRMMAAKEAGADSIMAKVVRYDGEGNVLGEELRPISIAAQPAPSMSFRELDQFRQDLASRIYPKAPPTGGIPAPPPKGAEQLMKVERMLADYLKEEAGVFLAKVGENPNAYNEANRIFSSLNKIEQVATKAVGRNMGNRMVSPSDHALGLTSALGAMATGNVGALGAMGYGAAGALANKLLRERGNSLVADLARRASETDNIIQTAAKSLAGSAEKVKAPVFASAFTGESLANQYQRTAERVRELAQPAVAMQHVSGSIQEVAAQYPNVGAAVSRKLLGIYQQLAAKLPQSHTDTGSTLTPLAIKSRIPPVAMQRFMSDVKGALEPERVISELGRGVIDRNAIESLKQAHPLLFQQLRKQVAEVVQERQDEVPFKRRVMLSMVFDFEGDSSLNPQRMAGLQEVAQSLSVEDAAKDAQMIKPKTAEPGKSKTPGSFNLPSQSALNGDM